MAARLNVVKSARMPQGPCYRCGKPIEKGDEYVWFKNRYSGRRKYHNVPECRPTAAERESNPKRQAHTEASASLDAARNAETPSEAAANVRDAIASAEDCIEQIEESLSNWSGTNFEYGEMAQSFEASRDALQEWTADAENVASTLEDITETEDPGGEPLLPDAMDYEGGEMSQDYIAAFSEYEDWRVQAEDWEAMREEMQAALDELDELPELEF